MNMDRLDTEVLIVGAGPAGLSMAIALKGFDPQMQVMILEKGRSVGNHILSGAVMDPSGLDELIPNWRERYQDFTKVKSASMYYLTKRYAWSVPHLPQASHIGGCIISYSAD